MEAHSTQGPGSDDDGAPRSSSLEDRLSRIEERLESLAGRDDVRIDQVHGAVARIDQRIGDIIGAIERIDRRVGNAAGLLAEYQAGADERGANDDNLRAALLAIRDDEPAVRARLAACRRAEGYASAYDEREPLVTVVIPTFDRPDVLVDRSVSSCLRSEYTNLEVLVVGDAAPPAVGEALDALRDPRLRFINLPLRPAYPEDALRRWLVLGTPPIAVGMREATGRFISLLGDDDELRADGLRVLVDRAQRDRLEFVYSRMERHWNDRAPDVVGAFPPALGSVGLQGSLLHSGLRWFEPELSDAFFGLPSDWLLVRRLWRAGVHIGFEETVTTDYHPGGTLERQAIERSRHEERRRLARDAFTRLDS